MTPKQHVDQKLLAYVPFVELIACVMDPDCEVTLHDTSRPESSVIACVNAHVTGRHVGSPMTSYGRELIKSDEWSERTGIYGYAVTFEDGRPLKCGASFIRDDDGRLIGMLCIIRDMSKLRAARDALDMLLASAGQKYAEVALQQHSERFYSDIEDELADIRAEIAAMTGASPDRLSPEEIKSLIARLDERGLFMLKGSVEMLSRELKKSRYTIYRYIRMNRSKRGE